MDGGGQVIIPNDASLDVKAFARDVMNELKELRQKYVLLDGSRMTGAGDAVTPTGLVTLRQLQDADSRVTNRIRSLESRVTKIVADNGLDE